MKLCKDCKHYEPEDKCVRSITVHTNPLNGKSYLKGIRSCNFERRGLGAELGAKPCCMEARFFEPKQDA